MPRRKPTPTRKVSGRSLDESERLGTRMNLRLDPDTTAALDALARRWSIVRSQVIARLITEAAADT